MYRTRSDGTGAFQVETIELPALQGQRANLWVLARGEDDELMGAVVVADGHLAKPVKIRLQPSAHVAASIADPEGRPVAGIGTVVVFRDAYPPGSVAGPRTDELGEMLIGPLPAGLPLGILVARESRHLVPELLWNRKVISLEPGEIHELPALTLDPEGRSIEGTVEDADGDPLPGAQVACHLPQRPPDLATADDQGRFRLAKLPVRGYDVWLIAGDTAQELYAMAPVDPDSGDEARLVLRPLTSAFGFLSGPDGQVLADVPVRVYPRLQARREGTVAYLTWGTKWVRRPEPVKTGEDGSWEVSGLIAGGVYRLSPQGTAGHLSADRGIFEVDREGEPTDIGLVMTE